MRSPGKPKFSYQLWRWTGADESLFDLAPAALFTFKLLAKEAA